MSKIINQGKEAREKLIAGVDICMLIKLLSAVLC